MINEGDNLFYFDLCVSQNTDLFLLKGITFEKIIIVHMCYLLFR